MDQNKFVEDVKKVRGDAANLKATVLLGEFLRMNLPVHDTHYVANRAIKILETIVKDLEFEDKEIKALRKKLLDKMLKKAIKKLDKIEFEEDADQETQVRNDRCEPAARLWITTLLNDALLDGDKLFVEYAIEEDDKMLFYKIFRGYLDEIHNVIMTSLSISQQEADRRLWGVDREKVTYRMYDDILNDKKEK